MGVSELTVGRLIEELKSFDPDMPVRLMWSHGAEPGPVSKVDLYCVYGNPEWVQIHGEAK